MILNVSGRTDIVAFFTPWFLERLKQGVIDVRNPFYPKQVSRIYLNHNTIEAIIFCTKNPLPILKYLDEILYPYLFQVTLTCYGKEIEPFVPPKREIVKAIRFLSQKLGTKRVIWRYDPIFLNSKYTIEYHLNAFTKLCEWLDGYIEICIISFLDLKKNVLKHQSDLKLILLEEAQIKKIASAFASIASSHHITLQTCAEDYDLREYGIESGSCINESMIFRLTGMVKKHKKNTNRKNCHCLKSVDIGSYNCCSHRCLYCYANYFEDKILEQMKNHDVHSSMLIGHILEDDIVKERKEFY